MNILNSIKEFGRSNALSSAKKQHLYLAYLQLHTENPGLHPDDYYEDGGYPGYGVLIVDEVSKTYHRNPDNFTYPTSFIKLQNTLWDLQDFHTDLANDDPEDDILTDYIVMLNDIELWLEDMKPTELCGIVDNLQKLYLYHACENDSVEEEAEKPAGVLKDCADVLTWILQQH
jgi:hypothetical protein